MIYWEQTAARRTKKGMLAIVALAITCGLVGCDGGYRAQQTAKETLVETAVRMNKTWPMNKDMPEWDDGSIWVNQPANTTNLDKLARERQRELERMFAPKLRVRAVVIVF